MIRFLFFFILLIAKGFSSIDVSSELKQRIHYFSDKENLIGYLHLPKDSPINDASYLYVKFAIDEFKKRQVRFVILDLDTPGGEVFAALKISKALKQLDLQDGIPVIAFVDNWALSAGALLAYSCRFIAVTSDALMGAAEPVLVGQDGKMESASEKINSALRAEFSSTASLFGRDPLIAEAMVDKDMILVERKGRLIRLDNTEQIIYGGRHPDKIISQQGKLLTLTAKEMIDLSLANISVPYSPTQSSVAIDDGKIPFASSLLSQQEFLKTIPNAYMIGYNDAKISFFSFLKHPLISSLLMIGLILGIYMEVQTPGFGFFGALALVSLSLILLSNFAEGAIGYLEVIALMAGIGLLILEIFVLPGFGVFGALGAILFFGALASMLLPLFSGSMSLPLDQIVIGGYTFFERLAFFLITCLVSIALIMMISRYFFSNSKIVRRIVLTDKESPQPEEKISPLSSLIGKEGIALSPLRPSGKVLIHGKVYSASAESFYIEKDITVIVCHVDGDRLFVKPA